jgi:hypothetical protein
MYSYLHRYYELELNEYKLDMDERNNALPSTHTQDMMTV